MADASRLYSGDAHTSANVSRIATQFEAQAHFRGLTHARGPGP
jgi:hypothetical protein